jgi:excisionase family DNA binding protein
MTDLEPPLRVDEAAQLLGISVSKLRELLHGSDPLPHYRIGQRISFAPEHIREIRERFTVRPERAPAKTAPVVEIKTRNARGPQRRSA